MRRTSTGYIFVLGTLLFIIGVTALISDYNRPKSIPIGPHQIARWHSWNIADLDGSMYVIEDDDYFALTQGDRVLQSQYKAPEVGEEKGSYFYPLTSLKGAWEIQGSADIYSLQDASITLTPTSSDKFVQAILYVIAAFAVWILFLYILGKYDDYDL